jgi:hypothetical protein
MKDTHETPAETVARYSESEITAWLAAMLEHQRNVTGMDLIAIDMGANNYGDEISVRFIVHGQIPGGEHVIGFNTPTIDEAIAELREDIASKPSQAHELREKAAEMIARAEAMEGKA